MSLNEKVNLDQSGDATATESAPPVAAQLVVMTTCPDRECADRLARGLVEKHLAACVNLLPEIGSVYRWQGAVEESRETLLFIKTTATRYAAVEDFIRARHPYELPEVIAVPIERGSGTYISWLERMVGELQ